MERVIRFKFTTVLLTLLFLSGCSGSFSNNEELNDSQREYILSKVNNYNGLIKLYREKLSRKEDKDTRYRLAEYYYLAEDFDSSRQYLQPLVAGKPNEKVLLLESKNLMELGNNSEAQKTVAEILKQNVKNGEAWNMQGILLTQSGDFTGAYRSFDNARKYFVDDDVVLNNLAMLAIMQNDYPRARDYLLPLYNRGHASQKALHNLVYVLVKLGDVNSAANILQQEKMADHTDELMEALAKVNPRPYDQLSLASGAVAPMTTSAKQGMQDKPQTSDAVKGIISGTSATTAQTVANMPVSPSQNKGTQSLISARSSGNEMQGSPETVSLSQTGGLKEISEVRSGRHPGYFRMTLESQQMINFREIPSTEKNKCVFELQNVKLNQELLRAANDIPRKHSNISKLTFLQSQSDTVLVEFEFTHPLAKKNVFRVTNNKTQGKKLVFDIYNG